MEISRHIFLLLILLSSRPVLAWNEGHIPRLELVQFETESEVFNLYAVTPFNAQEYLDKFEGEERRIKRLYLAADLMEAKVILSNVRWFLTEVSLRDDMIPEDKKADIRKHFAKIMTGKYPFFVVTAFNNPYRIFEVFGIAYEDELGILPNEGRTLGRGLAKKLDRPIVRTEPVPIRYVPRFGKPVVNEEISSVLSKIPRRTGGVLEARSLGKAKDSPHNFLEVAISFAVSRGRLLWDEKLVPATERGSPLTGDLLAEVQALQKKYPELPNELLFPELQEHLVAEWFYAHTLTESRERLYSLLFGAKQAVDPFPDPDFQGRFSHFLKGTRDAAEKFLGAASMFKMLNPAEGEIVPSPLHPIGCSTLVEKDFYQRLPAKYRNAIPRDQPMFILGPDLRKFHFPVVED